MIETKNELDEILILSINRIKMIADSTLEQTKVKNYKYDPSVVIQELVKELSVKYSHISFNFQGPTSRAIPAPLELGLSEIDFMRSLTNFIENSVEALKNRPSPRIDILFKSRHNEIKVEVFDNGAGIKSSILKKIGKEEVTSKRGGNGVGLKYTIDMLKRKKGSVDIESKDGEFTKVKLKIPIIRAI